MEKWQNVHPGGKTKESFEHGETIKLGEHEIQSSEDLVRTLENARRKFANKFSETEAPKSLEEIEFVGLMQMAITKERERLGLTPGFYIELERVKLYHPDVWRSGDRTTGGGRSGNSRGEYKPQLDWAETQTGVGDPYAFFRTLSHELLHQSSYFESDPHGGNLAHRVGYRMSTDGTGVGLDEALTEEINQELLDLHAEVLGKQFGGEVKDGAMKLPWADSSSSYHGYREVVKAIAERVDEETYKGEKHTWDNLKRGYLEGNNQALDDIKNILGPRDVIVLLAMGNPKLFDLKKAAILYGADPNNTDYIFEKIDWQIEKYFTTDLPESDKEVTLSEILSLIK